MAGSGLYAPTPGFLSGLNSYFDPKLTLVLISAPKGLYGSIDPGPICAVSAILSRSLYSAKLSGGC